MSGWLLWKRVEKRRLVGAFLGGIGAVIFTACLWGWMGRRGAAPEVTAVGTTDEKAVQMGGQR
jgi:hypothetical protein